MYLLGGKQCTGEPEGFIERNPGHFDPEKIKGLPVTAEVNNMFCQNASYDTKDYDKQSNKSFRNMLEGFSNPNTSVRGIKADLHGIRFASVFLRFFSSMKKYALFCPHF